MPTILALDQGTTGSTALVIDQNGSIRGRGYREIHQYYPAPGQVEHDPTELFTSLVAAAREAIAVAGLRPDAIGITNQRETLVLWDRETLSPRGRAIVWQDRRTTDRCSELREQGVEPFIRTRTGLLLDPYFSATKLEWLLRDSATLQLAHNGQLVTGTVDSWIIANLSGGTHITDRTNASRTMLANLVTGEWDPGLLELFGVPPAMLPVVAASSGELALVSAEWFGHEIPITGIAGDQQAALFGHGCETTGAAKITFGTGAFLLRHAGFDQPPAPDQGILATIVAAPAPTHGWALEGSLFIAGAAVQWLRDGLGIIDNAAETAALAASVPDTGGVMVVPAFTGLGAPYWNPAARGTITGLTRGTTRAHLVRATLESIAHGTADLIDAMGGVADLRVDGGAACNDWLMQFLADLTGAPVTRPSGLELTAYGAARLAALGIGASLPPAAELGEMKVFEPQRDSGWRATQRGEWGRAVGATIHWSEAAG
jgi:glycerol kinase